MSYLGDLSNAPDSFKAVLIYFFPMPFWFVAIYLFNPSLYTKLDLFTIGCFAFCFNVGSSMLFGMILAAFKADNSSSVWDSFEAQHTTVFHVIYMLILVFGCMIYSDIYDEIYTLRGYLYTHFGIGFVIFFILFIRHLILTSKNSNKNNS